MGPDGFYVETAMWELESKEAWGVGGHSWALRPPSRQPRWTRPAGCSQDAMTPHSPHWLGNLTLEFPKLSRGSPLFSSLEVGRQGWKEERRKEREKEERSR